MLLIISDDNVKLPIDNSCKEKHDLSNVLKWVKPGGRLILHNMISASDIDVYIKYKPSSNNFCTDSLESGWNIISEKSLRLVCEQNNATLIECKDFEINIDLQPNLDDPLRSWTESEADGSRSIYNALHIRQPQKIAVIKKLA